MVKFLTCINCIIVLSLNFAYAADSNPQELEKRIELLELKLEELKALNEGREELTLVDEEQNFAISELSSKEDHRIKIAGYADVEYKGSDGSANEEFRMHHLSLFFTKKFNEKLRFFSEIEYEDAPNFDGVNDGSGEIDEAAGTIIVEAMNFDWSYSQAINLRGGRFFTPLGIWSEDHYPPFVSTQERPLHIFKIFPQFVDGLSFHGSVELSQTNYFSYNLFTGNGESSISGKKDLNSSKAIGFRGELSLGVLDEFTLGFSLYQDGKDTANNDASKTAYGIHYKSRYKSFNTQIEFAKAKLVDMVNIPDYEQEGFYAQFSYSLGQWNLGYRFDQINDFYIDKTNRNSVFFNYHYDHNITLKGEYHIDDYDNPVRDQYGFYIFSISAYLGE